MRESLCTSAVIKDFGESWTHDAIPVRLIVHLVQWGLVELNPSSNLIQLTPRGMDCRLRSSTGGTTRMSEHMDEAVPA